MGYIRTEAFDTIIYHHTTPSEGGGEIVIYDQIKLFTEKGCRKTFERPHLKNKISQPFFNKIRIPSEGGMK